MVSGFKVQRFWVQGFKGSGLWLLVSGYWLISSVL